jgi:serine/threonine protein kinase
VGKYFEKIDKKIGNLKPCNILVTLNQEIKIIYSKTTINFIDPVDEVINRAKNNNILAPEELGFVDKTEQRLCQDLNPQVSEVFTMGMIVLSVANLVDPHTLYSYSTFSLDGQKSKIDQKTMELMMESCKEKKYSELLIQTLSEMLSLNPATRIKSSQLYKRLSQYESEIVSKRGLKYSK